MTNALVNVKFEYEKDFFDFFCTFFMRIMQKIIQTTQRLRGYTHKKRAVGYGVDLCLINLTTLLLFINLSIFV